MAETTKTNYSLWGKGKLLVYLVTGDADDPQVLSDVVTYKIISESECKFSLKPNRTVQTTINKNIRTKLHGFNPTLDVNISSLKALNEIGQMQDMIGGFCFAPEWSSPHKLGILPFYDERIDWAEQFHLKASKQYISNHDYKLTQLSKQIESGQKLTFKFESQIMYTAWEMKSLLSRTNILPTSTTASIYNNVIQ